MYICIFCIAKVENTNPAKRTPSTKGKKKPSRKEKKNSNLKSEKEKVKKKNLTLDLTSLHCEI